MIFLPKQLKKSSFFVVESVPSSHKYYHETLRKEIILILYVSEISFSQRKSFKPYARLNREKSVFSAKTAGKI